MYTRLFAILIALVLTSALAPNKLVHSQPGNELAWVDYSAERSPQDVVPMGVIAETFTARTTMILGPFRIWWVLQSGVTAKALDEVVSQAEKFNSLPGWEMGALLGTTGAPRLLCAKSDVAVFLGCIRSFVPGSNPRVVDDMSLSMYQATQEIMIGREPSPNDYRGVDFVVLVGKFPQEKVKSASIRDCFPQVDITGQLVPVDETFCAAYWLNQVPRIGLMTMCQDKVDCNWDRMHMLTGSRYFIRTRLQSDNEGHWNSLLDAVYKPADVRDRWVTAHLLSEAVIPTSLPKNCRLGGTEVSCFVTGGDFTIQYQALVHKPLSHFNVMGHLWTVMWEVRNNTFNSRQHCPGESIAYNGTAVHVRDGTYHQIYLPAVYPGSRAPMPTSVPDSCSG